MGYDIHKIKRQIHIYGKLLGMRDAKADPAEVEGLKKHKNHGYTWRDGSFIWNWNEIAKRYTQLVALRAHLRGKLHFAPNTNLEEAHFILGVPCMASEKTANGWHHVFRPITKEVQAEWVSPLMDEFELEEQEEAAA